METIKAMNHKEEKAVSYTVRDLWERGKDHIPSHLTTGSHLIYSSPATLAFNSPGAEGFGVKRAGLSVPGSVMLIVSPGCCGRNTSSISTMPGYENRFFYLLMDETDLVTGRHLKRIPAAVEAICQGLDNKPSVVMICITCVDALLGTDMERVCRKAQERAGVPVRPCYMYALTREGRKPPMVHVRQSLYSMLEKRKKDPRAVNLLGFFAPLDERSELPSLLRQAGIRTIRQIAACPDMEEFMRMSEANFSLVLNTEARPAAEDMNRKLGIPYIELTRLYQIDQIHRQYMALGSALGRDLDDAVPMERAKEAMKKFREAYPDTVFAVGEALNANPFELALALIRYGFQVREIYAALAPEYFVYLRHLAVLSPKTRVYSNLDPSMLTYDGQGRGITMTIGKDAGWYHPGVPGVQWNSDVQPFGFGGVEALFMALYAAAEGKGDASGSLVRVGTHADLKEAGTLKETETTARGYRRVLTPFAPDQSGAVAALYGLGGINVVVDAGGCTGNICGFDEPRWLTQKAAVFSAGLRDMDAILGRDDKLIEKLTDAAERVGGSFAALIGTPVPAVIGTDFRALKRMAEKKVSLPILTVESTGMQWYDKGAEAAYRELFLTLADNNALRTKEGEKTVNVIGTIPMDIPEGLTEGLRQALQERGFEKIRLFGMGASLEDVKRAGDAALTIAVSPAAIQAARDLEKRFGIPVEIGVPGAERLLPEEDLTGKRILILHQAVLAESLRRKALERGASFVTCAAWFMMPGECSREGDVYLKEEEDLTDLVKRGSFDMILGDAVYRPLCGSFKGSWHDLPHFAVSGRWE